MLAKCAGCKKISQCRFEKLAEKYIELIKIGEGVKTKKNISSLLNKMSKTISEARQISNEVECEVQDLESMKNFLEIGDNIFLMMRRMKDVQNRPEQ